MKANIYDLINDRSMVACAKCRETLKDEYARCPNGCYETTEVV